MEKVLKINCAHCKKTFNYYSSEFRPFCSDRCKMIDAGNWLNETYTIEGKQNTVYIEDEFLLTDTDEIDEDN